ncbi:MAG: helix-turn-helix domain-containing protein [Anaerocolumna sp.]
MEDYFGNRLMYLRKGRGLSQEELGNLAGVSRQTVSKWELNQTTPEMDKLVSLCDIFHISLDELVGRQNITNREDNYEKLNEKMDRIINERRPYHYEYKSKRMIGNTPFVHINIGYGMYHSKGIVSIGMISTGIISIGLLSCGILSFGVLALGILALGSLAVGLVGLGSIALGIMALGAISIGYLSIGSLSIGVYAIGANAIAHHIGIGDVATGHIAIGKTTAKGAIEFIISEVNSITEVKHTILREYPNLSKWFVDFCLSFIHYIGNF